VREWHGSLLITLLAGLLIAPGVDAQDIGRLFRDINPSVVVIRAKGRDVTAAGHQHVQGDRLRRPDLGRWQGHDRRPRRALDGNRSRSPCSAPARSSS
jgi:hypothetical protein